VSDQEKSNKALYEMVLQLEKQVKELKHRVSILEAKTPFKSLGGADPKLMTTAVPGRYNK
jgi:hypothetical protein